MFTKLSIKIATILVMVMIVIMAIVTFVFVRASISDMEAALLEKGRIEALTGAKAMERILQEALESGRFSKEQLFDENYIPIPATDPQKYHTRYDGYLENSVQTVLDEYLKDDEVLAAMLVDRNGYAPTHNTRYAQPLTGEKEKDRIGNRTKRIFNDPVGLAAARNKEEILRQMLLRDTGERIWDISAPVVVNGVHWGAFRVGYSMAKIEMKTAQLRMQIIGAMVVMLLLASITIFIVVNRSVRPLRNLTEAARRITGGNLDEEVPVESRDEIGALAEAFNRMTTVIVRNLREEISKSGRLILSIREAIVQLSSSAGELMAISSQQSSGSTEQASAVQEVSATSAQIAITAKQITDNTNSVEAMAVETSRSCMAGTRDVGNATEGMQRLKNRVQSIAESMLQLGENSQKIGGIVEIIDEISEQTNLLALNATIEAAGAGEAGRRFAIVAQEVRRLAERTGAATGQIKGLIEEIQKATNSTIMVTEEGSKAVDSAAALVDKVHLSFGDIIRTVEETARSAKEISLSTRQQTSACEQMAVTMTEVRDVAQQFAESARETDRAITGIMELAAMLKGLMEEEIQAKGKAAALSGARAMEQVLTRAVASGRFTMAELFDENYLPIAGTEPQKYHTSYDVYLDETIQGMLDEFLDRDDQVITAVLVDRNGYLPTHNSRYSLPLTGDRERDLSGNRSKRIFNDPVGIAAARNGQGTLVQVYSQDTGAKIWDISAPLHLNGRHWGAFRIGYTMEFRETIR
ncbi:MAG: methyl-accepting chemotaxis protein [Geobacteraceae bacterium]|nr:methyl-accepting chemotaxis protein [Geobacteraceae bacterium]